MGTTLWTASGVHTRLCTGLLPALSEPAGLRFHSRNRIIDKCVATGVFPTERRPGQMGSQDMEGSYESGGTLRTENQNRG